MRGPFTRFINLPRLLVLAGFIMLGIGFGMLYGGRTDREPGTPAPESALVEPVSGVLSEVDNPVSDPASEPEAGEPQSLDWAPVASVDLLPTPVRIPSIAVDSGVIDLGLNPDRTLQVPEDVAVTGWYTGRSVPGEVGPSVIVGRYESLSVWPTSLNFSLISSPRNSAAAITTTAMSATSKAYSTMLAPSSSLTNRAW
jgi:hypothetical protein